ncbi:hypothetical protein Btru_070773 [Bulinus truncatus]|nr:hypothetical protein Btru_070773 [Bulinus truncatus]
MNDLFYLGIIIPTVITIILFLVFIYCWFLQKARKEVLTKKYDPHGKMRRLGLSMDPPPPPKYCQTGDCLLPETGEDNCAYDVSRSPSTEQEGHGHPMYHTYHDSGISNCLSPGQEHEPMADFAYRACPDSGFSLSLNPGVYGQQHSDRLVSPLSPPCEQQPLFSCGGQHMHGSASQPVSGRREFFSDPTRPHQILTDQIQVHVGEQGYYRQPQHLPQADLQPKVLPASVHPNHGVCYGDDTRHPSSSQQYIPQMYPNRYQQQQEQHQAAIHANRLQQGMYRNPSGSKINMNIHSCSSPSVSYNISPTEHIPLGSVDFNYPMKSERLLMNIPAGGQCKVVQSDPCVNCLHLPLTTSVPYPLAASSVTSPLGTSHHYSNKDGPNTGQSHPQNNSERPDSQASQSSTTDSEDSGFRSSHCAAHHKSSLSKQGNPLLKPTRRIKNKNNKGQQGSAAPPMTPMVTLNPHNLPFSHDNALHTSSGVDLVHGSSSGVLKQTAGGHGADRDPSYLPAVFQKGLAYHKSPCAEDASGQAQKNENWPPQSTNDRETVVRQNIDLSDISTHLSWKYQQDSGQSSVNASTPVTPTQNKRLQQSCHQGLGGGQSMKMAADQHLELVGYSVV